MNRRDFFRLAALSGGASTLGFTSWRASAVSDTLKLKKKGSLHYIVFGDWGAGSPLQRDVAAAMVNYCRHASPKVDFAIAAGDNFYNSGISGITDVQWQTKFEKMYPIKAMNFPFYAVLGNHDWGGNPAGQISYMLERSRWRMEGFYYQISAPQQLADFFFVDTNLWLPQFGSENLSKKQTQWLDKALSESQARWKFCIGHHPPYTDGVHTKDKDPGIVRETLVPLLDKYGVHTLYGGHDHDLQHIQIEGKKTHFVVSGGGGGKLRKRETHQYGPFYQDMTGGVLAVQVAETIQSKFVAQDGSILHEWEQQAI
jgi:acid phosphatase